MENNVNVPVSILNAEVTPRAQVLFIRLLSYYQANVEFPTYAELARQMGITERQLVKCVRELEASHFISVYKSETNARKNTYAFNI
jgi:DNA-binding Lrp family transcriptional regulator